ncbi:hypothetical protein [Kribbella endophytica]
MRKPNKPRSDGSRRTGGCAAWCSPKHYQFCGSPRCCPHLHTDRSNSSTGKAGKR